MSICLMPVFKWEVAEVAVVDDVLGCGWGGREGEVRGWGGLKSEMKSALLTCRSLLSPFTSFFTSTVWSKSPSLVSEGSLPSHVPAAACTLLWSLDHTAEQTSSHSTSHLALLKTSRVSFFL